MRSTSIIIILIFLSGLNAIAQVKEYSDRGPDFAPLKDIRLGVSAISYVGRQQVSVEGHILSAAKYNIISKDPVPFQAGVDYNNVVKDLDMHYELMIADDARNFIHDTLIDILKDTCSGPANQIDFSQVGLVGDRGRYLIFSGPVSMPKYVWFDGRVVIARFVRFGDKRRDRSPTTETFWKEKIRFYPGGRKLVLEKPGKSFAGDFLSRYAAGEFVRPRT
ncbi:MAG TPA: hypothetical protein VMZ26_16185 [Pyrinomonadaceae bacterium]|nr:hypothetical protein [Pyrinomonadaceae bacterium]